MKKLSFFFCFLFISSMSFSQLAGTRQIVSDDVTIDPDTLFIDLPREGSIYLINNTTQPINISSVQQFCDNCQGGWFWEVDSMSFVPSHCIYPGQTELIHITITVICKENPDTTYLPSTMYVITSVGVQYCHILLNEDLIQTVNELDQARFRLYPNPASNIITIETSSKGSLSIFNLSGQELLQQKITEPTTRIDIGNLPNGVYFVRVTGESSVQQRKFIKQ